MKTPLVSIIIPSYNSSQFIVEAIESVLSQDYENWELIVVDDGSTDQIDAIVAPYLANKKIKYYKKENGGLSSARNYGIKKCKGDYILPLDADDKLHKEYILKAMAEFENNVNVKLVYAQAHYFGELNEEWIAPEYSFKALISQNIIFCSAIFKKSDFNEAGRYREGLLNGREDWDLWLRLLDENSTVIKIPEVLFYYRKHKGTSMSDNFANESLNNEILLNLYYYNKEVFIKYYGNPISLINQHRVLENKYLELKEKYRDLKNSTLQRIAKRVKNIFNK